MAKRHNHQQSPTKPKTQHQPSHRDQLEIQRIADITGKCKPRKLVRFDIPPPTPIHTARINSQSAMHPDPSVKNHTGTKSETPSRQPTTPEATLPGEQSRHPRRATPTQAPIPMIPNPGPRQQQLYYRASGEHYNGNRHHATHQSSNLNTQRKRATTT